MERVQHGGLRWGGLALAVYVFKGSSCSRMYRGYYMVVRRYEFYLRVVKTIILQMSAANESNIVFTTNSFYSSIFNKISAILNAKLLSMFGITWYFDEYGGVRYFSFNECHRHDHQNRWLYQSRFQAIHCNNIERSDHTVVYQNRQLLKVNFQRRIATKEEWQYYKIRFLNRSFVVF